VRYRTVVVGCGDRGNSHARAFKTNEDRFDLVALCDRHPEKVSRLAERCGVTNTYSDAEEMLARERPDILCFATLPAIRLPLIELGLKYGIKAFAFEKPMANELAEAHQIYRLLKNAGVKAIVSHQQKYDKHWRQVKTIVESGEIGDIVSVHGTARPWLGEAGTHLMDYLLYYNPGSRIQWVVAQAVGTRMLSENHPSADFVVATMAFDNGVRGIFECGAWAPHFIPGANPLKTMDFWTDSSILVLGTHGYAQVINGNGWRSFTKSSQGERHSGDGYFDPEYQQPLYIRDLADWLDGRIAEHPCNLEITYHGFEATMALYLSALDRRRITLPLVEIPSSLLIERLRKELPPTNEYEGQVSPQSTPAD
jgi:predicted dehydrogenase